MTDGTMTIGLDVSPVSGTRTGIGRYAYELLGSLASSCEHTIVPVSHRSAVDLPATLPGAARLAGPRSSSRAVWTFGLLPFWLRRAHLDIFHATSYYAPFGTAVPTVVTVHDLSLFAIPEAHPRARVLRAHAVMPAVARRAAAVIVPSETIASEAVRWLGVSARRVHVVPEAPSAVFRREPAREAVEATLARYDLQPGFLLAVGTLEPRKNLVRVIEALELLARSRRGEDVRLVVAGAPGWGYRPIADCIRELGLRDRVRFPGFVPDADLVALMHAAAGLVYPSLYEGFGLPVLEAMAAGLPVVTSNRGALAEVAGDAAILVDPLTTVEIARAMATLLDDAATHDDLAHRGRDSAARFDWTRTASETAAVYRTAIARGAAA